MMLYRIAWHRSALTLVAAVLVSGIATAQAPSRGSIAVFPMVFDDSGTPTSRAKATEAIVEIFQKGGFKLVEPADPKKIWRGKGYRAPTMARPATTAQLVGFGRAVGVRYVCTASVTFHTRSIWVNLGPKTVSSCHMNVTIIDTRTGTVAYESEGDGRSDEKSDKLKVAAALLVTPLVTAVSGGPKTPQETRAAQIAAAYALEKFIVVQ
jgi:hypothetical protein